MAMVRRVASPYNVNAVALAALPEALNDQEYVERYVAEVQRGRAMLERELSNLGLPYWPSRANFVLVRIGPAHADFDQRAEGSGRRTQGTRRGEGVRKAKLHRKTAETEIQIALTIEGRGKYEVSTGIRFLDHMLELFARHGGFDLKLRAVGDLDVDQHHTVEDAGIALG